MKTMVSLLCDTIRVERECETSTARVGKEREEGKRKESRKERPRSSKESGLPLNTA